MEIKNHFKWVFTRKYFWVMVVVFSYLSIADFTHSSDALESVIIQINHMFSSPGYAIGSFSFPFLISFALTSIIGFFSKKKRERNINI